MGGLQSLITFISNGSLACSMEGMQVILGVILAIGTMLFSKLFCSYICPIGTITEALGQLGNKLKLPKYEITGTLDILLRSLKYALLFATVHFTLQSNDLFCKTFDPYYAVATRYGAETNVLYATLALVAVIGGSLFLRQFWCRYLCPLGALSNQFKYAYTFVIIAVISIILSQLKVANAVDITAGIACILSFAFEIIGLRKKSAIQVMQVVRHPDACIDCGLCSKNCPQGILVDRMTSVNHPDCNMCTECISSCPKPEAISINKSYRQTWIPALISLILVILGLALGSIIDIPTINQNWGNDAQNERSSTFEMKGIKNVKCYGSSSSFVNEMKQVKGIIGAKTFIGDHHVILTYDTTMINAAAVRRSIFKPIDMDIHTPKDEDIVIMYDLKVENYFDELDRVFVANTLKEMKSVYGFKTIYEQPIKVRVFGDSTLTADSLAGIIEGCNLIYKTPEKSFSSKGLYTVSEATQNDTVYSGTYYKSLKFKNFSTSFNQRKDYSNDQIGTIKVAITSFPKGEQKMQFVANYLKFANKNVVGIRSTYTNDGPQLYIFFVKDKITEDEVRALLDTDIITVHYSNGSEKKMRMPYGFQK